MSLIVSIDNQQEVAVAVVVILIIIGPKFLIVFFWLSQQ